MGTFPFEDGESTPATRPESSAAPIRRLPPTTRADRPPTIIDLAAQAGVSKTTVSRVLNDSPLVAPATRARVLAAAAEAGFSINLAARSLRTSRTGLIGFLVPVISIFGLIIETLDAQLALEGFSILLTSSRRRAPERDLESIEMLVGRGVDALVLAPSADLSPELADYLRRVRTPVLLLDRQLPGVTTDAVLVDHAPGIRDALEMLAGSGKSHVGLLTRDHQTRAGRAIIDAWASESARLGIAPDPRLVAKFDDLDREAGRAGVDQLLAAGADAIVSTGTMEHTATVLGRLAERSVRVPADVSLVAYGYLVPPIREHLGLPMIVYPVGEVAAATQTLLHRRLGDREAPPRSLTVATVFVDSATVMPLSS
jgi:LacI family transcriptional regulator